MERQRMRLLVARGLVSLDDIKDDAVLYREYRTTEQWAQLQHNRETRKKTKKVRFFKAALKFRYCTKALFYNILLHEHFSNLVDTTYA